MICTQIASGPRVVSPPIRSTPCSRASRMKPTAKDRPYKKSKTLTESLTILGRFKLNGHIDPDLFDIFMWEKVYETYGKQFLDPEQIDEVDVTKIPGYVPPPAP